MQETLARGLEVARAEVRELRGLEAGLREECARLGEAAATERVERGRIEGELELERARGAEAAAALERGKNIAGGLRRQKEELEARVAELERSRGVVETQARRQGARLKCLQASQGFLHRQRSAPAAAAPGRAAARPQTCAGAITFGTL